MLNYFSAHVFFLSGSALLVLGPLLDAPALLGIGIALLGLIFIPALLRFRHDLFAAVLAAVLGTMAAISYRGFLFTPS